MIQIDMTKNQANVLVKFLEINMNRLEYELDLMGYDSTLSKFIVMSIDKLTQATEVK